MQASNCMQNATKVTDKRASSWFLVVQEFEAAECSRAET